MRIDLPRPHRSGSGFTLLELLIVLTIVALGAATVMMHGRLNSHPLDVSDAAHTLADTLRLARSQAIALDTTATVIIDAARHHVIGPNGAAYAIPGTITLGFRSLIGPLDIPAMAIGFAADGSSTGAIVTFSSGPRQVRVATSWLGGRVRVDDAP